MIRLMSAVSIASVVAAQASGAVAAPLTKVTAGIVAHAATQLADYWAADSGCARENGIEIDFLTVGPGGAQQLAAGSLDISQSGFPDYFRAIANGAPLRIFINNNSVPPYSIYAKPGVKTVAELKGKTISIGGVKDVTLIYMQPFLAAGGLKTSDVDFVYAKATADRLTALVGGAVDATILNPPASFRAQSLGFTHLGEIADHMKDYPFTVWAANTRFASKNRAAVVAFAKCHLRGVAWVNDRANRADAVKMIVKYAKSSVEDAEKTYDYMTVETKALSPDGVLTPATFERMKDGLLQMGDLKEPASSLDGFFDASYVAEAKAQAK